MAHHRLTARAVGKVWGRRHPGHGFADAPPGGEPIGEVWFEREGRPPLEPELLVKYLFTSERLSLQVHPDDAAARAQGAPRGKDEAWIVLEAEPDATIAIGPNAATSREAIAEAAQAGTLEHDLRWWPARAGDVFYSPAGTIHAIGHGLTVLEIQQNSDTTYRLYDYGRPRALHLEAALAAAILEPHDWRPDATDLGHGRSSLVAERALGIERWRGARSGTIEAPPGRPVWIVPTEGEGEIDGAPIGPGGVWWVESAATLSFGPGTLLVAYPGAGPPGALWHPGPPDMAPAAR